MTNQNIDRHIAEYLRVKETYPSATLCGSIALYLQGIDLLRDLSLSDLDVAIRDKNDYIKAIDKDSDSPEFTGSGNDFVRIETIDNSIKCECCFVEKKRTVIVLYQNMALPCQPTCDIIAVKRGYAAHSEKHASDLNAILLGNRDNIDMDKHVQPQGDTLPF